MNAPCTLPEPIPDSCYEILTRMLEIIAPGEGGLVAFLECYFDESGSHDGSPVLCVAGYLFDKDRCRELDLKWNDMLGRYKLPYFRMSSCAHNDYPFNHLTSNECDLAAREAIKLINDHALLGVAVAINERDYNTWFDGPSHTGSAYTFCCWQVLSGIRSWIMKNDFHGDVGYFFESGHDSDGEADALMKRIFSNPNLKRNYCYAAHAFVDKKKVRPVQTADILAWQQATQVKRWLNNDHRMRADFRALAARPRHELFIGNRHTAGALVAPLKREDEITPKRRTQIQEMGS